MELTESIMGGIYNLIRYLAVSCYVCKCSLSVNGAFNRKIMIKPYFYAKICSQDPKFSSIIKGIPVSPVIFDIVKSASSKVWFFR